MMIMISDRMAGSSFREWSPRRPVEDLVLWCYDDPQGWGTRLCRTALDAGVDARMFEASDEPDRGYAFVHMHHHPNLRRNHKRLMQNLSVNRELTLIPDYRSSILYDDKLEQARHLAKWMPPTRVFFTPTRAKNYLKWFNPSYPFISKSAEGASSNNVRIIRSEEEAMREIREAFSDRGIKMHYELAQFGYVLWQDFIPDNDHDIRVLGIGDKRLVLRRRNRPDLPFASGSRDNEPIRDLDDETLSALDYADRFLRVERMGWAGVDMVRDSDRWYILETTVGWTMGGYADCAVIHRGADGEWRTTDRTGRDVWKILVEEIQEGRFQ